MHPKAVLKLYERPPITGDSGDTADVVRQAECQQFMRVGGMGK